jgi:hypothetical protein
LVWEPAICDNINDKDQYMKNRFNLGIIISLSLGFDFFVGSKKINSK